MRIIIATLSILSFLIFSCNEVETGKNEDDTKSNVDLHQVDEKISYSTKFEKQKLDIRNADTIDYKVVVFYNSDSNEVDFLRKKYGDSNFDEIIFDNSNIAAEDTQYLDSLKVYQIADVKRTFYFRALNRIYTIRRDDLKADWGEIIFNGIDSPHIIRNGELRQKFSSVWK
ncbi:hypothetical protein [Chitinophaga sp. Cy-1792]|uniref:hypothetical protein n=1 Tax=Chitinophaga sp. Cy-1792 TaxID=2608339 RepID=UPI0014200657|nr:hypothetical protein [Chitinophaga sp. Cy-1792]NIG55379.1 hypothetical protein [Chitinophaga sp. Cy-1792]